MSGLTLVLGGVRSGKSVFAEQAAAAAGPRVLYVATALATDAEMESRVRRHRTRRLSTWGLIEEPYDLTRALGYAGDWDAILLESVSGWLSNLVLRRLELNGDEEDVRDATGSFPTAGDESGIGARLEREAMEGIAVLLESGRERSVPLIAVSDETGLSLVPPNFAGRLFQDLLGSVNQALAAQADAAYLVVAGLPLQLKGAPGCDPAPSSFVDPDRR